MKLVIGAESRRTTPRRWSSGRPIAPPTAAWPGSLRCGRRRAEKGECRLTLDDVAGHSEGLIAGVCGGDKSIVGLGQDRVASAGPPSQSGGGLAGNVRSMVGKLAGPTLRPRRLPRHLPRPLLPPGRTAPSRQRSRAARSARGAGGRNERAAGRRGRRPFPRARSGSRSATCSRPCGTAARWPRPASGCFPTPSGTCNRRRKWPRSSPVIRRPCSGRWKSPGSRPSRSTSCVTNIPRSLPRPARRRWNI